MAPLAFSKADIDTSARHAIADQLSPRSTVYDPPEPPVEPLDDPDDVDPEGADAPDGRQTTSPGWIVRSSPAPFAAATAVGDEPTRTAIEPQLSPDETV